MCCCCPPKCLKLLIFIACIILIGVGAVLIWAGYQLQNSIFLDLIEFKYAGYIIIACGAALILISFFGFVGTWKEKKLLLCIFIFIGVLISIILIAFGAIIIYARKLSEDYFGNEADCHDQFEDADKGTEKVVEALCTLYCPCLATDTYTISYLGTLNEPYSFSDKGAKNVLDCDPCLAVPDVSVDQQDTIINWVKENLNLDISVDDCSVSATEYKEKYFTSNMRKYFPLLKWVEESFDCSGLCIQRALFMFSDVNNGEPKGSCMSELNDWAAENFLIYGIVSIILGSYMVLVMFMSCTICCCNKKKNKVQDSNTKQ
ncbi:hypothetical protein SteCoe_10771 [Stentor coeruleus]|uniref:Tetraspanin family protein n=1 Tax=Stentor coeruleus TaxID=5963 RepID=A0A1R2CEZ4_9CILI|nr:hypothetical protein SteCoe_10771 [Stentor coeruleus]